MIVTLWNRNFVEAAGIEPASEFSVQLASTCLGCTQILSDIREQPQFYRTSLYLERRLTKTARRSIGAVYFKWYLVNWR